MNLQLRKSADRGGGNFGWLDTKHSFSFGDYYDAQHMGFGPLRVINEDWVEAGEGFPTHPHADMEIITYVLEGALQHRDSLGNGSVIRPGDVQRMSAGTGIWHSEFNGSKSDPVHLLQIWIIPERKGFKPSYEQKAFADDEKRGRLRVLASPDGRDGSVTIHQNAELYASILGEGQRVTHELGEDRLGWVQVARGAARLNGELLQAGDGVSVDSAGTLELEGDGEAEVLLFDMASDWHKHLA